MRIHRGEVYFIELGPTVGREQAGRRPVVVVSNDVINAKPLVVTVVPGTRAVKAPASSPANVFVAKGEANLPQDTVFLTFQVKSVDSSRLQSPAIGALSSASMEQLEKALSWSLGISH